MSALFCLFLYFRSYSKKLEVYNSIFFKIRYILEELYVPVRWIISRLIIYIDQLNTGINRCFHWTWIIPTSITKIDSWLSNVTTPTGSLSEKIRVVQQWFLTKKDKIFCLKPSAHPFSDAKSIDILIDLKKEKNFNAIDRVFLIFLASSTNNCFLNISFSSHFFINKTVWKPVCSIVFCTLFSGYFLNCNLYLSLQLQLGWDFGIFFRQQNIET